jgi:Mor family transcriptional regulator
MVKPAKSTSRKAKKSPTGKLGSRRRQSKRVRKDVEKKNREYRKPKVLKDLFLEKGMSAKEIAEHFSVTETTIYNAMKKHGLKTEKPYNDPEMLKDQYENGATLTELGKKYGCCITTIGNILRETGVEIRRGRSKVGDKNYKYQPDKFKKKLSSRHADQIRDLYNTGEFSYSKLAKKYNVSRNMVYLIVNNKSWKKGDIVV